jgi:stage II sporulation SpoAA-like protein
MTLPVPPAGDPGRCVLRHVAETNIVRATLSGPLDLGAFAHCASQALALARKHATARLLFDYRNVHPAIPSADIHRMAASAEAHGLTPRHRIAMLYATRTLEPMDMLLWENVFTERGYETRTFVDEDQALQWLSMR